MPSSEFAGWTIVGAFALFVMVFLYRMYRQDRETEERQAADWRALEERRRNQPPKGRAL